MPDSLHSTTTVSAADISRNFGEWQSRALMSPVTITHHGRPRLILQSVEDFESRTSPARPTSAEATESAAQLRAVLGQMREGFVAFDAELRVTDANAVAEIFTGRAKEDLVGRTLQDLIPEMRDGALLDLCRQVLRTRESTEMRHHSLINHATMMQIRILPYGAGVAILFTNLASAEDALLHQRSWKALADAIALDPALGLLRLNARGGVVTADAGFCAMTGFSQARLATLLLAEIVHPRHRIQLGHEINRLLREQASGGLTVTFVTRDGGERELRLNMSPAPDIDGSDGIIACVVDPDRLADPKRDKDWTATLQVGGA